MTFKAQGFKSRDSMAPAETAYSLLCEYGLDNAKCTPEYVHTVTREQFLHADDTDLKVMGFLLGTRIKLMRILQNELIKAGF